MSQIWQAIQGGVCVWCTDVWVTCCVLVWRAGLINCDDVVAGSWPSASEREKQREARLSVYSSAYLMRELKCFIVVL